ncbi:cytochrome bc complex cytochrome b subunit [candidate division KSB1 bacterium]
MSATQKLIDYIDERLGILEIVRDEMTDKQVPTHARWWDHAGFSCFGGLSLVLFIVQAITGFFLLIYYIPEPDHAFASLMFVENNVAYGWLFRRIHGIAANLMMITVIVHMLKVFFTGAYHKPREMHWLSGFTLFLLTMGLCFSGYVLPWTQMAFWATTVVTESMQVIPYIGVGLMEFLRGGANVAGPTLGRFFMLHMVLPAVTLIFLAAHFFMIRKTGIQEPL